jgi:hypothetical protein
VVVDVDGVDVLLDGLSGVGKLMVGVVVCFLLLALATQVLLAFEESGHFPLGLLLLVSGIGFFVLPLGLLVESGPDEFYFFVDAFHLLQLYGA